MIVVIPILWGGIEQPLAFNHKIHAENDLVCLDCHHYFQEQAFSGRPELEVCQGCHEEAMGESEAEKKLIEHIESGEEIEWNRLYRVPEDVYFSHRRHVTLGEVDCKTCHGNIGESVKPPAKPLKQSMKKCMGCHEKREASNDCIACHK